LFELSLRRDKIPQIEQCHSNAAVSRRLSHHVGLRFAKTHQLLAGFTCAVELGAHHVKRVLSVQHAKKLRGLVEHAAEFAGSRPGSSRLRCSKALCRNQCSAQGNL
jgi:hypothetical protein